MSTSPDQRRTRRSQATCERCLNGDCGCVGIGADVHLASQSAALLLWSRLHSLKLRPYFSPPQSGSDFYHVACIACSIPLCTWDRKAYGTEPLPGVLLLPSSTQWLTCAGSGIDFV